MNMKKTMITSFALLGLTSFSLVAYGMEEVATSQHGAFSKPEKFTEYAKDKQTGNPFSVIYNNTDKELQFYAIFRYKMYTKRDILEGNIDVKLKPYHKISFTPNSADNIAQYSLIRVDGSADLCYHVPYNWPLDEKPVWHIACEPKLSGECRDFFQSGKMYISFIDQSLLETL